MGLAEQLKGKKASVNSPFIMPYQRGVMEIKRLLNKKKTTKGPMFIAEFEVLKSEPTLSINPETKQPPVINAAGTAPAWRVKMHDAEDNPGPGNVIAFLLALLKKDETWLQTEKGLAEIERCAPDSEKDPQPCEFYEIGFETWEKPTRAGKPFTLVRWTHVPLTEEKLKAIAAYKAKRKV